MPIFHLRSPDGRMIDVQAPDQNTAIGLAQQRFATLHAGQDPAPIGEPMRAIPLGASAHPQHPQSEDWWRSTLGGLAQGANSTLGSLGGVTELGDRVQDLEGQAGNWARGMLGQKPNATPGHTQVAQTYDPSANSKALQHIGVPTPIANAAANAFFLGGYGLPHGIAQTTGPQAVHDAELKAVEVAGGPGARAAVSDVVDYEPQTTTGRVLHRGASFLPGAGFPGSNTQRALAVVAPTLGTTVGGEGARALGASPEAAANAELVAGLLAAGAGGASLPAAERAATNVSDAFAGPRVVPTTGATADLITALKGGTRAEPGVDAPTFRRSDLQGAANLLAQHVARVGRASGEDFGAMSGRVGGMGDQAMLADALQDLSRNVADRGSFGQQFLGQQLNQRQLGVMDPTTGAYSEPSAAMRLDAARRSALGVPAGAFDTTEALTRAQEAQAGPLYDAFRAEPPVSTDALADFRGPDFDNAYARAARIARRNFAPIPDQPGEFVDPQTLNLIKQGFDDLAGEGQLQGIGANEQGAARNFAQAFRGRLDELYPDTYPQARAAFAGPAAIKDAIDFGRGAYSMDPSELAGALRDYGPSERQGVNVGFYQSGRDATLGKSQRLNAAEALGATNPDMMARNQALMGDNFGDWNTTLGNEATFFNTRNRALGGSATSRNLLGAEDAAAGEGVNPFEAAAGLVRAAHGDLDGVVETAGNAGKLAGIAKLFAPKPSQMTEGTADVLGTILGTRGAFQDPQTADLIQALMNSAQGPNYSAGIVRPAALLSAQNRDEGNE